MFRSNTCADFYGPCSLSHSRGTRDRGGGKRNRCSSVARNDALSASVARGSAQKPIPERRSDRHFYRGGGRWKYFKSVDNFHESGACNNKYKRRNGNELLRSMINVTQRDIVIARGTGLGT